uniref:Mediator complex subunit 22 n=1 Tax=Elaeophora elaphi TaxID=1147741 RepID=A0A0R3S6V2_9BILA
MHSRMSRLRRSLSRGSLFNGLSKSQLSLVDLPTLHQQSMLMRKFSAKNIQFNHICKGRSQIFIYQITVEISKRLIMLIRFLLVTDLRLENVETPTAFPQLRQIVHANNEILREIISIFDERASLDFAYSKTMQKLSARLHKVSSKSPGYFNLN